VLPVTRADFKPGEFERFIQREFKKRARRALQIYRRTPLVRDQPGYPFAQRPGDGSIRDARASSIRSIPNGVRITVQSRGAPFLEEGNDAGGARKFIYPTGSRALALPLKGRQKKGGMVVIGEDGQPYLMRRRVRTYRGRNQLRRSVAQAFGVRLQG
jgi:hypothetical protein